MEIKIIEIKIFECEILDLIKKQDSLQLVDPRTYFLRYSRARYEQARADLISLKKLELQKQGIVSTNAVQLTLNFPNPVPAWGWE